MQVSGIYLQKGGTKRPEPSQWIKGFDLIEANLAKHSVQAGYIVTDYYEGVGKFRRYAGNGLVAETSRELTLIDYVGLASTPKGLAKPGWNWNALCDLSYLDSYGRLSLTFMVDHTYCEFGSPEFEDTLQQLVASHAWDFGYAMIRDKERGIEMYLGGIGGGDGIDKEDGRRGQQWYSCYQPEERRKRVRDIFPYNMVGLEHLAQHLPDGRSLRAFIETDADSELSPLTDNLWLWKVKRDRTEAMRDKLRGMGIIIAE
jgi:hypothetical protein